MRFGCTSYCCANSASVFSPFTAANATLALNAGLWFRRGRLLILPPARGQHGRCQTGNPLIPAVQISRATSESARSEEHTSELQSLMRISYAVFCFKKKKKHKKQQ